MAVTITITVDDKGGVNVSGPLNDKILCYGVLEAAKLAIKDYQPSPIIQPTLSTVKPINGS